MRIHVPVLLPAVGIAVPYLDGDFLEPIHYEGCQIVRVGWSTAVQRFANLCNIGMMIMGVTVDYELTVSCSGQILVPEGERRVGKKGC